MEWQVYVCGHVSDAKNIVGWESEIGFSLCTTVTIPFPFSLHKPDFAIVMVGLDFCDFVTGVEPKQWQLHGILSIISAFVCSVSSLCLTCVEKCGLIRE